MIPPVVARALYILTVFASAFLLFLVQPLIAKFILPWFGGTPAVWNTCLVFFQTALLAGYAYAHVVSTRMSKRAQAIAYAGAILVALAVLPITPGTRWIETATTRPVTSVLGVLAATVGLPFFVLASTAPLLQAWIGRIDRGFPVYRLYAVSNLASVLALLAYPVLVEPHLARLAQTRVWSWGFAAFAALAGGVCLTVVRSGSWTASEVHAGGPPPSAADRTLWLLLPAATSALLIATTNVLCLDVASVPFLWIVPLVAYLLTYVLAFAGGRGYPRGVVAALLAPSLAAAPWALGDSGELVPRIGVFVAALFFACWMAHGEVARSKPGPAHLTAFYFSLAAGGAAGGAAVALIAPVLLPDFLEYHAALLACVVLIMLAIHVRRGWRRVPLVAAMAGVAALAWSLQGLARDSVTGNLAAVRNFHGVLRVVDEELTRGTRIRKLLHGSTVHGTQILDPARKAVPTTYYAPASGIGRTMRTLLLVSGRKIGIVGLGTGTIAAYARESDEVRFYEINPAVRPLAERYFTYLSDCRAPLELVLGDARLALASEPPQGFHVLVLDAFSSDAVPVHLLTVEAFEIYLRHLDPVGVLAVHVSNQGLDLRPVVKNLADHFGIPAVYIRNRDDVRTGALASDWILLTRNRDFLDAEAIRDVARDGFGDTARAGLWTDERTNLFRVLR